jgi:flagellin-like protein
VNKDEIKELCNFIMKNQKLFKGYLMKGISPIIATIMMLMITIVVGGTAYIYVSGVLTGKTAVVLSIEYTECKKVGPDVYARVYVKNDGTQPANARIAVFGNITDYTINIPSGLDNYTDVKNTTPIGSGYFPVTATPSPAGSPIKGMVYCTP